MPATEKLTVVKPDEDIMPAVESKAAFDEPFDQVEPPAYVGSVEEVATAPGEETVHEALPGMKIEEPQESFSPVLSHCARPRQPLLSPLPNTNRYWENPS